MDLVPTSPHDAADWPSRDVLISTKASHSGAAKGLGADDNGLLRTKQNVWFFIQQTN